MDVETANDLRENEIPDDMVLEIDDSCNASTEANDDNEIDNAATQLSKDSNADRECEGALDENDSADCVLVHVQPRGGPESVGESNEVADSMTKCVKNNQDSSAVGTGDSVGTHYLVDVSNEDPTDVKMTEADKVKGRSEKPTDADENWVVIDEANEEENSEFANSVPAEGSTAENPDITDEQNADPFYCAACNVRCEDNKAYFMHTRGMMHTLNSGATKTEPQKPDSEKKCDEGLEDEGEKEEEDDDNCQESWLAYKAESDNYYCEICECSMNSIQNYETHLKGGRHIKNVKNRAIGAPIKKPKGKTAFGNHLAKIVDQEPMLQQMIEKCKEPIIGLQYVTEFCHVDPEFEPVYACNLCESKCDVRMIIKHLTGFKHRIAYMKKHFVNYAVLTQHSSRKSDQTTVAETYAAEIEAKEGRQKMVVRLETSYVNSAGLEPSEYKKRRSSATRSISPRSDSSGEHWRSRKGYRRSRSRSRSRSHGRHRSRYSRSPPGYRRRGQSSERHERDYRDFYRNERFRQGLASMYQRYPTQYPLNQGVPYGAAAAGYGYSALPSGQFSKYRASMPLASPASMTYQGFSNQISYPPPRMQYGASGGFHSAPSLLPAPSMVPPVMPPTDSAADKMSSYYQGHFGASTSKYGVGKANAANRSSLSRMGSTTLSSVASSVSANLTDDTDEAGEISKVIAEAILKYKLQKSQEKRASDMPFYRF